MSRRRVDVESTEVQYTAEHMTANYEYRTSVVRQRQAEDGSPQYLVSAVKKRMLVRTGRQVQRTGLMLVGWGGNNGSTFTAALLANKLGLSWPTKKGTQKANWYGSITQASTVNLGLDEAGRDVFVPMSDMVPMLHPDDVVVDGWDINSADLAQSMERARVLDVALQQQLRPHMAAMRPRASIYDPNFIAANQSERANNVLSGTKYEQYQQIRRDIRDFRDTNNLQHVCVLWTANTERYSEEQSVHSSADKLMKALQDSHPEISPSTIFALAAIDEGCSYINGSPQNTFVPGVLELARTRGAFVAGDDFKSGQTKLKSVLVDFLVTAGLKPMSIVSYNHLGNNDGKNLSEPQQFRSKEISKSSVVDDMVESNRTLYSVGEKPDHVIVIKYVPYVGDSKRAIDEYSSEIMLGGVNTLVIHNTCEDSLLAAPLMLDLTVLTELLTRTHFSTKDNEWESSDSVLSVLSYLVKAPLVAPGAPVVNSLARQRAVIDNVLRAALGLPPIEHMHLHHKIPSLMSELRSGELFSSLDATPAARRAAKTNGNSH